MFFDEEFETLPRGALEALQLKRLVATAERVYSTVPFYKKTFDRLIHESDEIRQAPRVKIYGSYRYYDPVENNDFWWEKSSIQRVGTIHESPLQGK